MRSFTISRIFQEKTFGCSIDHLNDKGQNDYSAVLPAVFTDATLLAFKSTVLDKTMSVQINFPLETRCPEGHQDLVLVVYRMPLSNLTAFGRCYWIVPDTADNEAALRNAAPAYDSRVFLLSAEGPSKEVYSIDQAEIIAQKATNLDLSSMWERRKNLRGHRIKAGYVIAKNWLSWKAGKSSDRLEDSDGIQTHLFQLLTKRMNFSVDLIASPDGQYGSISGKQEGNMVWSGMIGQVGRNGLKLNSDFEEVQAKQSLRSKTGCQGRDRPGHKLPRRHGREIYCSGFQPVHDLGQASCLGKDSKKVPRPVLRVVFAVHAVSRGLGSFWSHRSACCYCRTYD